MDSLFFSVVIPTHNRSLLLKRAVDSVFSQTFENFEIIIVDDHSTDDTPTVVKEIIDQRFRYIKNQRTKGACGARNTGIFAAKGQWVAFLDDDDVWFPEKLLHQYSLISKSKDSVGLICSDYAIYKGKEKKLRILKNRPSGWVREKILFGGCIGCLSSVCVRTDILYEIDGFDESFPSCQDQDLWLQVAHLSEFVSVPKTLVCMYQEKRNRISLNPNKKLLGNILLRDKYYESINKDIRLKCRYASIIFIFSFILKKRYFVRKSLLWFLIGIIIDFPYSINNIKLAIHHFYIFRKKIYYLPWT